MKNPLVFLGVCIGLLLLCGLFNLGQLYAQDQQNRTVETLAETNRTQAEAVRELAGAVDSLVDQNGKLVDEVVTTVHQERQQNNLLTIGIIVLAFVVLLLILSPRATRKEVQHERYS